MRPVAGSLPPLGRGQHLLRAAPHR